MTEITNSFSRNSTEIQNKEGIKSISLLPMISIEDKLKKNIKPLLGVKRKSFKTITKKEKKNKSILSINKQTQFVINKTKTFDNNNIIINNKEPCIICFEKISFQEKHFLHCGHCFHCDCINKWLDFGNYECPICKQDIECDKVIDNSISLEEIDEDDYVINVNNIGNNNINNRENGVITNYRSNKDIKFILILYILIIIFYMVTFSLKNS